MPSSWRLTDPIPEIGRWPVFAVSCLLISARVCGSHALKSLSALMLKKIRVTHVDSKYCVQNVTSTEISIAYGLFQNRVGKEGSQRV